MTKIDKLMERMIEFDSGDPKRIQHFIKVHSFAHQIGVGERLDAHTQEILEAAAIVHDIGIHPAEAKYGRCDGKLQEQEGPAPAGEMLKELDFTETDIERICYLIAHHHTYENVEGMDYRILLFSKKCFRIYNRPKYLDYIKSFKRHLIIAKFKLVKCEKFLDHIIHFVSFIYDNFTVKFTTFIIIIYIVKKSFGVSLYKSNRCF